MQGLIEVKQYTNAADMRAGMIAARNRTMFAKPPAPPRVVANPVKIHVDRPIWENQDAHCRAWQSYLLTNMGARVRELELAIKEIQQREIQQVKPLILKMCDYYKVSYREVIGDGRKDVITFPRQKMMWVIKKTTLLSFPSIGRRFGNRDHTTVLHSVNKIDRLIASNDPRVRELNQWLGKGGSDD